MSKILVTGGAGFIGSTLVDKLISHQHSVTVIDNLISGKKEYLNQNAQFYQTDICDAKSVDDIFKKEEFDYVFHLAAQIDVRISVSDPVFDNQVNIIGAYNILESCRKYNIKKIIFTSTGGAIYGEDANIPTMEGELEFPLSPYGINKLSFEKYLNYYYKVYGVKYIALRLANAFGPRQYKGGEAGVISIFTDFAINGKKITINGDGKQTRDYVFVDDIVDALISGARSSHVGEINISTEIESDLLSIIDNIEKALGHPMEKEFGPAKVGEQRRSCLSNKKAKEILEWEPKVFLEEGLKRTIEWSKMNILSEKK